MKRLISIDFLRGMVILLMTLDHVRDMFSSVPIGDHLGTGLPLSYYLTRWITHFCAPTFVFLSGLSIVLRQQRHGQDRFSLQSFTIKRGLFLLFISSTIVSFFWSFILRLPVFTVICAELWAIGAGLIFVAIMLYFRPFTIFLTSAALVLFHNMFDFLDGSQSIIWTMLHVKKEMAVIPGWVDVFFYFPILPWCGIAGLGYSAGHYLFNYPEKDRSKALLSAASLAFLSFIVLRYSNFYGDHQVFVASGNVAQTLFSFFDVTKYPPSLLYTLVMLCPVLVILALDQRRFFAYPKALVQLIAQYGKCALPYYIVHLLVISMYAQLLARIFNHGQLISSPSLVIPYVITALVIITMYPFVLWFTKLRATHSERYPILTYF